MKNEVLISVIIPVYNAEKYLRKCVDSVLGQTYPNIEIILVDDGSTDNSATICDEYFKKYDNIKVINKKNGGLSSARNAGLDVASGNYIGFIDADDFVSPDMYEHLLVNSENRTIANCEIVRVNEDGIIGTLNDAHTVRKGESSKEYLEKLLLHLGDSSVCTKLFPKNFFDNNRFDEKTLNEDFKFMVESICKFDYIKYTGTVGYYYLKHTGSITSGYGATTVDMVNNSLWANEFIEKNYPDLILQSKKFALHQHMVYLLLLPKAIANKKNQLFIDSVLFIRKNVKAIFTNPFLPFVERMILIVQVIFPLFPGIFYKKSRKIKNK